MFSIVILLIITNAVSFAVMAFLWFWHRHHFAGRERVEEELRNLSRAIEQSQISVMITDTRGLIEYVNPKFSEVTGYTFEEIRGQTPRVLRSAGASPEVYKELWDTITAGRKWHGEFHNQKKNGELFWESTIISPITNKQGLITHFVAVKEDITERKRTDENLRESRENFQRYFNMSTVGMGVTSPDRRWIETNGRLRQMLGYSAEELDHLTWTEITHPADLDADLGLHNQILVNERDSYQLDKRLIRKDGSIVFTTVFVTCHRNPVGTVRYLLVSLVDITDRKQGEESLLKLAAIEERQRLARDLHDSVNQSIHGMVLFSETLVSTLERNNTERARQIAGRLQESARQALKETRLMLYEMQTSGLVSGGDFLADLETRLATVERRAGVKGQIFQEGSIEDCPRDWYENLFWITIEALNNALKHAQARSMQIQICCSAERITLEISDDGIGFDQCKPRLGGLGLQNMRDRAGLLGGELTIHSAPGKGSCVRFSAEIKEYHGQNQTPHHR